MLIRSVIIIVTILVQLVVGHMIAFIGTFAAGIGGGLELIVWPFWNTVGIWSVGAIIALLRKTFNQKQYISTLVGTIIGSAIGAGVILLTPPIGYIQLAFPLIGALVGFYAPFILMPRLFLSKEDGKVGEID